MAICFLTFTILHPSQLCLQCTNLSWKFDRMIPLMPLHLIFGSSWFDIFHIFLLIWDQKIQSAPKIHHPGKAKRFTNVGVDPQIRESSRVNLWIHSSPFRILRCDTVAFPRCFLLQWFHSSIYWRTNSRLDRLGCGVQKKQDGTSKKSARKEPSYKHYQTSMFKENH